MYFCCCYGTFVGVLLPELVTCLIIIEKKTPELLHQLNVVPSLHCLLDSLDAFNRCAPGLFRDDTDDMSFPSLQGLFSLLYYSFWFLFDQPFSGILQVSLGPQRRPFRIDGAGFS